MFREGDQVKTIFGEIGHIVRRWDYHSEESDYDWWVDITFQARNGKQYTMREMYRDSELIGV